jgi:glucokinase
MDRRFYRYGRQRNMFCYDWRGEGGSIVKNRQIVVADVGGTHARFAVAQVDGSGVASLGEPVAFRTADHENFENAWKAFAEVAGALPPAAAVSIAGPVIDGRVKMTNGAWALDLAAARESLGLETIIALNDFAAIAHAVAQVSADQLLHITGPDEPLPQQGTITVIGPGTGLGVAHLHRFAGGYHVQATEGGHIGFAPQDEIDDRILASLRSRHGRVVTERVHAGSGIVEIYAALGGSELSDDREIWSEGLARHDAIATRAVDRFCASLGTVAGDYALAHGASAVVLAGGVGQRLRDVLAGSDFGERFRAKPRYEAMMALIPVKLITHSQPGLYGAAAAFSREQG